MRSPSNSRNSCLPTAVAPSMVRPSSCAAPSAKRPCGLDAEIRCPTKLWRNWIAIRWMEWPSGIAAADPRRVLARSDGARRLELGELGDPALVPGVEGERLGEERVDQLDRLLEAVLPGADGDHVRVVVLSGALRRRDVPQERRADAFALVRRDLLPVAGSAEHDAERLDPRPLVADDRQRGADDERRVVVERVV